MRRNRHGRHIEWQTDSNIHSPPQVAGAVRHALKAAAAAAVPSEPLNPQPPQPHVYQILQDFLKRKVWMCHLDKILSRVPVSDTGAVASAVGWCNASAYTPRSRSSIRLLHLLSSPFPVCVCACVSVSVCFVNLLLWAFLSDIKGIGRPHCLCLERHHVGGRVSKAANRRSYPGAVVAAEVAVAAPDASAVASRSGRFAAVAVDADASGHSECTCGTSVCKHKVSSPLKDSFR